MKNFDEVKTVYYEQLQKLNSDKERHFYDCAIGYLEFFCKPSRLNNPEDYKLENEEIKYFMIFLGFAYDRGMEDGKKAAS